MSPRVIVLGVGNAERGDDGVGRAVAKLLNDVASDQVSVVELDGEATSLLMALDGAALAYIVDACVSGAAAGTVHRIDAHEAPLPQVSSDLSTHGFGLAAAIELGRALGQLPARTIVYAIEGTSFDTGTPLSPPVAAAAAAVAERIRSEIEADLA
ncbi:MAG: hydrogenase maturation protease [Alphaproteobacteria bacterium]|nr:hydrogenase maturation protease [Alphaproteobacteria bacterium]